MHVHVRNIAMKFVFLIACISYMHMLKEHYIIFEASLQEILINQFVKNFRP
jgi:hypothetical protein